MSKPDNTQAELQELLNLSGWYSLAKRQADKPAAAFHKRSIEKWLTAYTNKQVEAALDRLIAQKQSTWADELADDGFNSRVWSVPVSFIEGEIKKLKESK